MASVLKTAHEMPMGEAGQIADTQGTSAITCTLAGNSITVIEQALTCDQRY